MLRRPTFSGPECNRLSDQRDDRYGPHSSLISRCKGKVVAQLMGHANVDTTLNVYTQALEGAMRAAVEKVGDELFTIVHSPLQRTSVASEPHERSAAAEAASE